MIFESRHRRFLAEINIIPLVDVVLVLLIIFMVTAPMLYRGMDITLPTSSSNTIKPEERLVLTIERDQKVYLDKDLVPVGLLESKLKAAKQRNADVSVYLRADRDVAYGTVVQVMDGVKRAGIEKLGMVTDPQSTRERVADESKRKDLVYAMQKIDFDRGGYIIAAYNKLLDITTSRVHGFEPAGTGIVLGNADWAHAWMS